MSEAQEPVNTGVTTEEFSQLYGELRRMAHARMSRERNDHTLQTTALVHEAFMRISGMDAVALSEPRRFFPAAALAMRRILIEHARARGRKKRGGEFKRINLDTLQWLGDDNLEQTLMFDQAICRLELESPDEAQVVRLRFYAGLDMEETAEVLDVSISTVERRWRYARAWLWRELKSSVGESMPE